MIQTPLWGLHGYSGEIPCLSCEEWLKPKSNYKPIPAEKREYGKYERNQTLRNCLNYCRHRLKKHQNTGLHKIGCQLEFVEQLEREFFPKQPDIQPKPKDRIEPLDPADICHCDYGDTDRITDHLITLARKINENTKAINKMLKERMG
jgi:hypothetical protein